MNAQSADSPINILYEKKACLCLNKPGGLLTQSAPNIDSLDKQLKQFIKERDEKPGKVYVGVPHRLDRPVTGAIVMCRNVRAARRLTDQFKQRSVTKTYWAFVSGHPTNDSSTWTDYIRKIPDTAQAEICSEEDESARLAELSYQVLDKTDQGSLLEIQLGTGRYHQIRIQCSSRGLAILGDELYGSTIQFGPETENHRERHIALHARYLKFRHPMLDETVEVTAPLTEYWNKIDQWNSITVSTDCE